MNEHDSDAGCYLDIRLRYWQTPEAVEYVMNFESNLPEHWDDEAKAEVEALKQQWKSADQLGSRQEEYDETSTGRATLQLCGNLQLEPAQC